MDWVIESKGLGKRFGDFWAVREANYQIQSGEIFGLLGPNAAGKSTSIRLLAGIYQPDSGTAKILHLDLEKDIEAIRHRIGYVAQHFALYPELTVRENLLFYAGIYHRSANRNPLHLLDTYKLSSFIDKKAGNLSGGYKRRLSVACALVHDPQIVFLDEPTAGIDPVTRKELWDIFFQLAASGKSLFVTTHYMEEAERCNRLAFINNGCIIIDGTPGDIIGALDNYNVFSIQQDYHPALNQALREESNVFVVNQFGNQLRVVCSREYRENDYRRLLDKNGIVDAQIHKVPASMEDAFVTLTRDE